MNKQKQTFADGYFSNPECEAQVRTSGTNDDANEKIVENVLIKADSVENQW